LRVATGRPPGQIVLILTVIVPPVMAKRGVPVVSGQTGHNQAVLFEDFVFISVKILEEVLRAGMNSVLDGLTSQHLSCSRLCNTFLPTKKKVLHLLTFCL
jgi:hypothetical protein